MNRNAAMAILLRGISTPDLVALAQGPSYIRRWVLLSSHLDRLVKEYYGMERPDVLGPELRAQRFNDEANSNRQSQMVAKILGRKQA